MHFNFEEDSVIVNPRPIELPLVPTSTALDVVSFLDEFYERYTTMRRETLGVDGQRLFTYSDQSLRMVGMLAAADREALLVELAQGRLLRRPLLPHKLFTVYITGPAAFRTHPKSDNIYISAKEQVMKCMRNWGLSPRQVCLVSRGGALFDHIAVDLFLTGHFGGLHVYMPYNWNHVRQQFADGRETHERADAFNMQHRGFELLTRRDSLREIAISLDCGARYSTCQPMHRGKRSSHWIELRWAGEREPLFHRTKVPAGHRVARVVGINLNKLPEPKYGARER